MQTTQLGLEVEVEVKTHGKKPQWLMQLLVFLKKSLRGVRFTLCTATDLLAPNVNLKNGSYKVLFVFC